MASQSVLEDLREAFNLFDINKDGQIDARELRKVLKCLSFPETEEECKKIIKSLDTDRNGQLSFDELCGIFEASGWCRYHNRPMPMLRFADTLSSVLCSEVDPLILSPEATLRSCGVDRDI